MSAPALEKYLRDNPVPSPPGRQQRKVIVISDSKGKYLHREITNTVPERDIVWHYVSGRTTQQAADYIIANVESYLRKYNKILLVVWTGTCDLTKKINVPKSLSAKRLFNIVDLSPITVDDIVFHFERIVNLNRVYGDAIKTVILECPYYSIQIWNKSRGHPNSELFVEKNKILHDKVSQLNDKIRSLNQLNSVSAPKFSLDLIRHRKSNKSHPASTVSYSLFLDGLHPAKTLSKYWIRRLIISVVFRLCFQ